MGRMWRSVRYATDSGRMPRKYMKKKREELAAVAEETGIDRKLFLAEFSGGRGSRTERRFSSSHRVLCSRATARAAVTNSASGSATHTSTIPASGGRAAGKNSPSAQNAIPMTPDRKKPHAEETAVTPGVSRTVIRGDKRLYCLTDSAEQCLKERHDRRGNTVHGKLRRPAVAHNLIVHQDGENDRPQIKHSCSCPCRNDAGKPPPRAVRTDNAERAAFQEKVA